MFTPVKPLFIHRTSVDAVIYPSRRIQTTSRAINSVIEGLKYYCEKYQLSSLTAQQLGFDMQVGVLKTNERQHDIEPISDKELRSSFELNDTALLTRSVTEAEYKAFVGQLMKDDFLTLINPRVNNADFSYSIVHESLANHFYISGEVERFNSVSVTFKNEDLVAEKLEMKDDLAHTVQQMYDTMQGSSLIMPSRHKGRLYLDEFVLNLLPNYAEQFRHTVDEISSIIEAPDIEDIISDTKSLHPAFLDSENKDFVDRITESLVSCYKEKFNP